MLDKNRFGLALGTFIAAAHVLWFVLVFAGLAGGFVGWLMGMHFMNMQFLIENFVFWKAFATTVLAFAVAYAVGFALAALYGVFGNK